MGLFEFATQLYQNCESLHPFIPSHLCLERHSAGAYRVLPRSVRGLPVEPLSGLARSRDVHNRFCMSCESVAARGDARVKM